MPIVAATAIINAAMAMPDLLTSAETIRAGKRPKIPNMRPNKRSISFINNKVKTGVSKANPNSNRKILARPKLILFPEKNARAKPPVINTKLINPAVLINRRLPDSSCDRVNTVTGEKRVASKAGGNTASNEAPIPNNTPLPICTGVTINEVVSMRK